MPLALSVPVGCREVGLKLTVTLSYSTAPECSALQWLPPAQTAGKQRPFMFSQCQAVHARALVPCPDAPACKFTYDAKITVPAWATAVMSAEPVDDAGGAGMGDDASIKRFCFKQERPIPSYLLAIAVGELGSKRIGPRSCVWAEPCMVEAVAWEFAETESFIAKAEDISGHAYEWSRYDILCMPPSFPFGGMENPCLTFATPTLLAGDRSLANVVCHEIAHSWMGNLVTNHTWEHFWLNEGWCRWLEERTLTKLSPDGEALTTSTCRSRSHRSRTRSSSLARIRRSRSWYRRWTVSIPTTASPPFRTRRAWLSSTTLPLLSAADPI